MFKLAIVFYDEYQSKNVDNAKKLLYFLRKLDMSEGFTHFYQQMNRTFNSAYSLIPSGKSMIKLFHIENIINLPKEAILEYVLQQ